MTLADRQIEALGQTWTLRFSLKAFQALEEHFEASSLEAVSERLEGDVKVADLVAVLWAGFRSHHPETTPDQALDILDELGIGRATEIIRDGFAASVPASGEGADATPPGKPGRSKR